MPERKKMSANMIRPATAIAGWRTKTSFPSLAAIHSASRVRVFVPASGRLEVAQTAEIAGFRLGAASPGGRLGRPGADLLLQKRIGSLKINLPGPRLALS